MSGFLHVYQRANHEEPVPLHTPFTIGPGPDASWRCGCAPHGTKANTAPHAVIVVDGDSYRLRTAVPQLPDGSTPKRPSTIQRGGQRVKNQIAVNGKAVTEQILHTLDVIQLPCADTVLIVDDGERGQAAPELFVRLHPLDREQTMSWAGAQPVKTTARASALLSYLFEHRRQLCSVTDIAKALDRPDKYVWEAFGELSRALKAVGLPESTLLSINKAGYILTLAHELPADAGPVTEGRLPRPRGNLIGRRFELSHLNYLLRKHHVIGVTGLAGSGKARLCLELALYHRGRYPLGTWWVDLTLPEAGSPLDALASVLGIPGAGITDVVERLKGGPALVVFDGAEEQPEEVTGLLRHLRRRCLHLDALVSARRLPDKFTTELKAVSYQLGPLSLPERPAPVVDPELDSDLTWEAGDAVDLFLDRARDLAPQLALDAALYRDALELCRRLDGMPSSIEEAAAMFAGTPDVSLLLANLPPEGEPPRYPTPRLRSEVWEGVEWAMEQMTPVEQSLFVSLAGFQGSLSSEAFVDICAADDFAKPELQRTLGLFTALGLLLRPAGDAQHYRLPRVVRDAAAAAAGMNDPADRRRQHLDDRFLAYYEPRIATLGRMAWGHPDKEQWRRWLRAELSNVERVLHLLCSRQEAERLASAVVALARWYIELGRMQDGWRWCEHALAQPPTDPALYRDLREAAASVAMRNGRLDEAACLLDHRSANLPQSLAELTPYGLLQSALLARYAGKLDQAEELALRAQALLDADNGARDPAPMNGTPPAWTLAMSYGALGIVAAARGDFQGALHYSSTAAAKFAAVCDRHFAASGLTNAGLAATELGLLDDAEQHLNSSVQLCKESDIPTGWNWTFLGRVSRLRASTAAAQGDTAAVDLYSLQSVQRHRQARTRFIEAGAQAGVGKALANEATARILAVDGEAPAIRLYRAAIRTLDLAGDREGVAIAIEDLACSRALTRHPEQAALLLGAAMRIRGSITAGGDQQRQIAEALARIEQSIGAESRDHALVAGQDLTNDQVLTRVLDLCRELEISCRLTTV